MASGVVAGSMLKLTSPSRGSMGSREKRPQSSRPSISWTAGCIKAPISTNRSSGPATETPQPKSTKAFLGSGCPYTRLLIPEMRRRLSLAGTAMSSGRFVGKGQRSPKRVKAAERRLADQRLPSAKTGAERPVRRESTSGPRSSIRCARTARISRRAASPSMVMFTARRQSCLQTVYTNCMNAPIPPRYGAKAYDINGRNHWIQVTCRGKAGQLHGCKTTVFHLEHLVIARGMLRIQLMRHGYQGHPVERQQRVLNPCGSLLV